MIQCSQCGSTFADEATYCNRCGLELNDHTAQTVFDHDQLTEVSKARKQDTKYLRFTLIAIAAFTPFALWAFDFVALPSGASKLFLLLLIELSSALCLLSLRSGTGPFHNDIMRNASGVGCALLLLFLSPLGLVFSATLVWHLVRSNTSHVTK